MLCKTGELNWRQEKKLIRCENPERNLPERCAITITICNSDDATQSHRKCTGEYKLHKSQEKVNHLMDKDAFKVLTKNEKELETLIQAVRIYIQDIGIEFGIEKYAILIMKSGKRQIMEGIELPNQEKNQNIWRMEIYKYLGT